MNIEHRSGRGGDLPQSRKGRQGTQRRKRGGMKFLILDFKF
jgi:hypothetical protein